MKKRLLAIFLTIAMVVTLLPTIILADGEKTFKFEANWGEGKIEYSLDGVSYVEAAWNTIINYNPGTKIYFKLTPPELPQGALAVKLQAIYMGPNMPMPDPITVTPDQGTGETFIGEYTFRSDVDQIQFKVSWASDKYYFDNYQFNKESDKALFVLKANNMQQFGLGLDCTDGIDREPKSYSDGSNGTFWLKTKANSTYNTENGKIVFEFWNEATPEKILINGTNILEDGKGITGITFENKKFTIQGLPAAAINDDKEVQVEFVFPNSPGPSPDPGSNFSLDSIAIDPIVLGKDYDGYYDGENFNYVINLNKVTMTLKYHNGMPQEETISGTWDYIKNHVDGIPANFTLQVNETDKATLGPINTKEKEMELEYAITQMKPSGPLPKTKVKIVIEDRPKSKENAAKDFINGLVNKDGKLSINSVKYTKDEDIKAAVDSYIDLSGIPEGVVIESAISSGKVTLTAKTTYNAFKEIRDDATQYQTLYNLPEKEVNFSGALSDDAVEYIDTVSKKINTVKTLEGPYNVYDEEEGFYVIEDLDLFNYHNTRLSSGPTLPNSMINFSKEYRDTIGNANITSYYTQAIVNKGDDDGKSADGIAIGRLVLSYDGCVYKIIDNVGVAVVRVFYVPTTTEANPMKYSDALANRIKAYGIENAMYKPEKGNGTVVQYQSKGGIEPIVPISNLKPVDSLNAAENKYYIKDNVRYMIIADDEKAAYKGSKAVSVDIDTKSQVSTDSATVPLDTTITVKVFKKGDEVHDKNLETIGLKEGVTYDIELDSVVVGNKIRKLDNGKFEVKVPVPESYYGANATAYYVDSKGKVENHTAKVIKEGNEYFAVFETNHFSAYTVGKTIANPKTGDANNMMLWIFMSLGALIVLSGAYLVYKKKAHR